uniref:Gag-pol polyprotein n=1 Tax=Solanum tuberosum TaxID=4113 RepID=M1DZR4_SOLTU
MISIQRFVDQVEHSESVEFISKKFLLTRTCMYLSNTLRRVVRGHPARRNVEEQGVPNAPKVQPQGEVEEDKLRYREEFRNEKAKTSGNESGQQKSNANRSSFQHKQKGPAPSSASAPAPRRRDPGEGLSLVTPYTSMNFNIFPEQLLEPFSVSTHVGESILAERVYRDCTISVNHKSTMVDLVELDMVDFHVIQGTWIEEHSKETNKQKETKTN